MRAFEGTVLAVVHDRYFIRRFASAIWAVRDGTLRRYIDLEDLQRARVTSQALGRAGTAHGGGTDVRSRARAARL
jgi:hypothetical protein